MTKVEGLAGSAMGGLGLGGLDDSGVMGGVLGGVMGVFPEDVGAKVTVEPCEAGAAVGRPIRPSRAHQLLTRRAREVFDAVVASSEAGKRAEGVVKLEGEEGGDEDNDTTKLTQLRALEEGLCRHCPPRHPSHFFTSFIELDGIPRRGKQYVTGPMWRRWCCGWMRIVTYSLWGTRPTRGASWRLIPPRGVCWCPPGCCTSHHSPIVHPGEGGAWRGIYLAAGGGCFPRDWCTPHH